MSAGSREEEPTTPTKFGRYDIVELLATGGMARVYKASTSANRIFTIKKILPEFSHNQEFIKMFLEEAKISLSLKHSNIVRVIDFGVIDGTYYLAMEYVFGKDIGSLLKKTLEKKIHVPIDVACQIIIQCCRGMEYAHRLTDAFGTSLGIIHRDISPPNIFLSYNGEAKILDFGIAKAISAAENKNTRSGVLKGKFSYMSPEQTLGEYLTAQSDLFSLGIVLHELLTSRSLFYTRDEIETLERVRKADVAPPSKTRKGVPRELDEIVLRALQPKIKRRYESCGQFADDLESLLRIHYPRTDRRAAAKFLRLMFEDDFQARLEPALAEGWKDVFISGGDDQDLMLDRQKEASSSTRSNTHGLRVGVFQKILYDPKISRKLYATIRVVAGVFTLIALGTLFLQSDNGKSLIQSWKVGISSPPEVEAVTKVEQTPNLPLERGSLVWWVNEAELAEKQGDILRAIENLERALKINPYERELLVRRQFLQLKRGELDVCEWFRVQKDVSDADQLLAGGACQELSGNYERAVVAYSDFVKRFSLDPRSESTRRIISTLIKQQNL